MGTTTRSARPWMGCMPCAAFSSRGEGTIASRVDTAGWGLFLLWVGIALLLDLGWGVGLLGVGILTIVMQAVRRGFGLKLRGFWLFVGGAAIVAAFWNLAAIDVSPGPILLIALGTTMVLAGALRR